MPKPQIAPTTDDKSISRSVSMLQSRWELIDGHAPTTPGKDRSGYLQALAEADLRAAGLLPEAATNSDAEFETLLIAAIRKNPGAKPKIAKLLKLEDGQRRMGAARSLFGHERPADLPRKRRVAAAAGSR